MKITAYKCDRCGKLYENGGSTDFTLNEKHAVPGSVTFANYDLCHDCQLGLKTWFREGHKE